MPPILDPREWRIENPILMMTVCGAAISWIANRFSHIMKRCLDFQMSSVFVTRAFPRNAEASSYLPFLSIEPFLVRGKDFLERENQQYVLSNFFIFPQKMTDVRQDPCFLSINKMTESTHNLSFPLLQQSVQLVSRSTTSQFPHPSRGGSTTLYKIPHIVSCVHTRIFKKRICGPILCKRFRAASRRIASK